MGKLYNCRIPGIDDGKQTRARGQNSVRRIFPILGETGTTSEVLALARDRKQTSG